MENLTKVPNTVEKPKQVTPEKTTEKKEEYTVEIVRDFYGKVDPFYLTKKDPNYAYRFLRDDRKSGGKNISIKTGNLLFDKGGWQLCPKTHLLGLGIKESELTTEGFLRRGDTILAFMPKKLHDEKLAHKQKVANETIDAVKRKVEGGDPTEGLLTKKQLGMK